MSDKRRFDPEGNLKEPQDGFDAPPAEEEQSTEITGDAQALVTEAEVLQLRGDLDASRKRVDDLARAFQALNHDREEFKQRLTRERERMLDVEKGNVALGLLEAVDELDLCLVASADDKSPLAKGVRLIRENLMTKLLSTGIERIQVVGARFDPNLAEAGDMEMTTDPAQDQQVVAEVRAGYRLKGRVIRPARVKVAKFVQPASA